MAAREGSPSTSGDRKLAARMFTDIVSYTALTQSDESLWLFLFLSDTTSFFGLFSENMVAGKSRQSVMLFWSSLKVHLDAVQCSMEIQKFLHDYNSSASEEWKIKLRIGIHLGDVVRSSNDVLGDAVNIA